MSKTIQQLATQAAQIEEATRQGENTALRVGGLFTDIVEYLETLHLNDVTLGPLLTALNNSQLLNPSDGSILAFSMLGDKWTFSDAIAQLKLSQKGIEQTVASNYEAFLRMKGELEADVADTDRRVREYKSEYDQSQIEYATWKSQTATSISQFAAAFTVDGRIVSMSEMVQTAYDISTQVTNNKKAADKAMGKLFNLAGLDYENPNQAYTASWIYQNRQGIYGAAATFDSEGNIIQDSVLSVTIDGISLKAENAVGQVSLISQSVGLLQAEVSRNKEISDAGYTQLSKLINDGDESLQHALQQEVDARTAEGQTTASRLTMVEGGVSLINGRFDSDGHPLGWSELKATVDGISATVEDHTGRLSSIQVALGVIQADVASNKEAAEAAFTNLSKAINDGDEDLANALQTEVNARTAEGQSTATRLVAVEGGISALNARFTQDGELIGWSELTATVDEIRGVVASGNADIKALQNAINGTTGNPGIISRLGIAENSISNYSDSISYIQQNRNKITATVGYFDSNGRLTSTSGLVTTGSFSSLFAQAYSQTGAATKIAEISVGLEEKVDSEGVRDIISTIKLSADQINMTGDTFRGWFNKYIDLTADMIKFNFTTATDFTSGGQTVMRIKPNGDLLISGTLTSNASIDGIRTADDGTIQRYNPNGGWQPLYAARAVRNISSNTYLNTNDDYIIAGNGTYNVYLPTGVKNGKVITIKNLNDGIYIRSQGSASIVVNDPAAPTTVKDLDNYDRAELVYYNGVWYWNYMET